MIVGVWWKLFKNYFAGKPLREASQILGNFRLLGKSKQSYRAISSVLCFWRENGLGDFFPLHQFHGDICCLERTLSHSLSEGGVEGSHLPCPPGHPRYPRWGSAEDRHCPAHAGGTGMTSLSPLLCLPPEGTEAQGLGSPHPPQESPKGAIQAQPGVSLQLHVQLLVVPASPSISGFPWDVLVVLCPLSNLLHTRGQ